MLPIKIDRINYQLITSESMRLIGIQSLLNITILLKKENPGIAEVFFEFYYKLIISCLQRFSC